MPDSQVSNAYVLFQDILKKGYHWIEEAVRSQKEEGLFLDFKLNSNPNVPGVSKDDRKNYSKLISAFANSGGGVIVWGIDARRVSPEEPDIAQEERPIKGVKKFLTDLNSLASDATDPIVQGIDNILIEKPDQEDTGFVVSYVPDSDYSPHRALIDQNYYQRTADNTCVISHSILALIFGRKMHPSLKINVRLAKIGGILPNKTFGPSAIVGIENVGRYMALYPTLSITPNPRWKISTAGLGTYEWALQLVAQDYQTQLINGYRFSGDKAIYPGTTLDVCILLPNNQYQTMSINRPDEGRVEDYFSFDYSIYTENADPVKGAYGINSDDFYDHYEL
jgi:hypothetical protein